MNVESLDPKQLAGLIENFSVLAQKVLADEKLFQTLVAQNVDGLLVVGEDNRILYANPAADGMFHADVGRLAGKTFGFPVQEGESREIDVYTPTQRKACAEMRVTRIEWNGQPAHLLSLRIGSEGRHLKESLRKNTDRLHTLINASPLAIVAVDVNSRVTLWNRAATRTFGWTEKDMLGQPLPQDEGGFNQALTALVERTLNGEGQHAAELSGLAHKDGGELNLQLWTTPLHGARETLNGALFFAADISEHKRTEERFKRIAGQDIVTGLPNRSQFRERLRQALERVKHGEQTPFAVLHLGLDRFKNVNHSLGHGLGDELLGEVARRLSSNLYDTDIVARSGGDEFSILLRDIRHVPDSARIARKLLEAVAEIVLLDSREIYVTASIGIALYPHDGIDADSLLRHADSAMARAKEKGGNVSHYYTDNLETHAREHLFLESHLHHALECGELELFYQPQVESLSGRIIGVESLLRWNHPELGMVAPGRFIPVAENSGLIVPLGAWVLHSACRQGQAWRLSGLGAVRVAVNISARQLEHPELVPTVAAALRESGFDPQLLELELTESMLMKNPEEAMEVIHALKRLGVRLSIDDFGTGYSALSYLARLPLDTLKIDRSFVTAIGTDTGGVAIVAAVVALAHSLGLSTVAEGVETGTQLEFLNSCFCDEIQGFYFSRPVPVAECTALLAAGRIVPAQADPPQPPVAPAVWRRQRPDQIAAMREN